MRPLRGIKTRPEDKIVEQIRAFLAVRGWFTYKTHGSMFQSGLPDLFVTHSKYRQKWIEVKDPERRGEVFTPAQLEVFPKLSANGSPIWVLTGATEIEYAKLFQPENWYTFLGIMK